MDDRPGYIAQYAEKQPMPSRGSILAAEIRGTVIASPAVGGVSLALLEEASDVADTSERWRQTGPA